MRITRRIGAGLAGLALVGGVCLAQAPEGPPKPGPEHKRLARYVGTWNGKGEMKPGPFGPAGAMSWTETCDWFPGGFALVCKSDGKGPAGEMKGLSILGYDPERKVYTFYGVDNSGWAGYSTGSVNGKVWTYSSTETMGGKPVHGRFIITELSDTKHTFTWDVSEDGKTWKTMMDGEATK